MKNSSAVLSANITDYGNVTLKTGCFMNLCTCFDLNHTVQVQTSGKYHLNLQRRTEVSLVTMFL